MTPRRREIDWLSLLAERPGSEAEARRVAEDPALARRLEALRELVEQLRRYRREQPVGADDLIEAAEGRAGAAALARIDADPELRGLVEAIRAATSEPVDEPVAELPPLPAAIREKLAETAPPATASTSERLARTLQALGRSATAAAQRAAEIMRSPESAVAVPAASDDLTRVEDGDPGAPGSQTSDDETPDGPAPRAEED
jgi:hypothetical protein